MDLLHIRLTGVNANYHRNNLEAFVTILMWVLFVNPFLNVKLLDYLS